MKTPGASELKFAAFTIRMILYLMLFGHTLMSGQTLDIDKIIVPEGVKANSFEDYLVQLAWQNQPVSQILDARVAGAQYKVKEEKRGWINALNGSIAFNSIKDTVAFWGNQYLAPGYTYGISFNLFPVFANKSRVQGAEEMVKIEQLKILDEKLSIRKNVLERYANYKLAMNLLKSRQQAEENANANYQLLSELFSTNKAEFDEYNQAAIAYYSQQEKRLEAEAMLDKSIISLEEILGVAWEKVQIYKKRYGE